MRIAALIALTFCACSSPRDRMPEIGKLYEHAAADEVRNPVIVLHGILGSQLRDRESGKIVWGAFTADAIDPSSPTGAKIMALPFTPPKSALTYDPEREPVYAAGPLEELDISIFYQLLAVEVYASILRTLSAGGFRDRILVNPLSPQYTDDHYTCHTFFYDWRRDNVENAILLGKFMQAKRIEIDESARRKAAKLRATGEPQAIHEAERVEAWLADGYQFDIVAHSMGGLIARYLLRFGTQDLPADGSTPEVTWAGSKDIGRMVIIGTPSLGSMGAFRQLIEGFDLSFLLPHYNQAVLGSMPSIYQLLPRVRHQLVVDEKGRKVDLDFMDPARLTRPRVPPCPGEQVSRVVPRTSAPVPCGARRAAKHDTPDQVDPVRGRC